MFITCYSIMNSLPHCNIKLEMFMRLARKIWGEISQRKDLGRLKVGDFGNSLDVQQLLSYQCRGDWQ